MNHEYLGQFFLRRLFAYQAGYTSYDMWLAKSSKDGYAYGAVDGGKVMKFDENTHLTKLEVKTVESFGDDLDISPRSSSDFSLD